MQSNSIVIFHAHRFPRFFFVYAPSKFINNLLDFCPFSLFIYFLFFFFSCPSDKIRLDYQLEQNIFSRQFFQDSEMYTHDTIFLESQTTCFHRRKPRHVTNEEWTGLSGGCTVSLPRETTIENRTPPPRSCNVSHLPLSKYKTDKPISTGSIFISLRHNHLSTLPIFHLIHTSLPSSPVITPKSIFPILINSQNKFHDT